MPSMDRSRPRRHLAIFATCALTALLACVPAAFGASGGATAGGDVSSTTTTPVVASKADPFAGNGMWIWNIPNTERGDPVAIGARARTADLSYVVVKAAHGTTRWSGFTPDFIATLHAQGLQVCGYQRVQTAAPTAQAKVFAAQVKLGADCAVIDAESELEGRYNAAKVYMKALRTGLGTSFPIAFTSFPWIGYHPTMPYSVFLGPGGAQVNMPQIYWKDIGVSVGTAFANTYPANRVYGRPIRPIGQLYMKPSTAEIQRFRSFAGLYGSTGYSWWDWEEAAPSAWTALYKTAVVPAKAKVVVPPTLKTGSSGDLVLWARARLKALGTPVSTTKATFDAALGTGVVAYQAARGLPQTGMVDPATWTRLVPAYGYGRR